MSQSFPIPRTTRGPVVLIAAAGQTAFVFPFWLHDGQDVEVRIWQVGNAGYGPPLAFGSDYLVSNLDQNGGATVNLAGARAAGDKVRLTGRRVPTRTTSVVQGGTVKSVPLELELDLLNTTQQELRRDADQNAADFLSQDGRLSSAETALLGHTTRLAQHDLSLLDQYNRLNLIEPTLADVASKAVRAPESGVMLPPAAARAGHYAGYGPGGGPIVLDPPSVMVTSGEADFATTTAAIGAAIPSGQTHFRTAAWAALGDPGGAVWAVRNAEPAHRCKFALAGGKWAELAVPEVRPEMRGATGGNVLDDAAAMLDVLSYQAATGAGILLRSGLFYKMGDTRLQDWKTSRIRADGAKRAILDFSDATDYATSPQNARIVVKGTPDVANAQTILDDLISAPPVLPSFATPPSYDAMSGLITWLCLRPHGFTTGQRIQVNYDGSDPGAAQRRYLTMGASDEGMALSAPVPITVVDALTFTYAPPLGGVPAATMTLSGVVAYVSTHYVRVASTAAFARDMLCELRSDRLHESVGGGQALKQGNLRRIARVVSPTLLELDEGIGPNSPYLVSENASIVPIPDAPDVHWERIGVKVRSYNPAGGLGDSAACFLYCRPTLIDCGPVDNDYYGFAIFCCDSPYATRIRNSPDKRNEGGAVTGFHTDAYSLAYGGSCRNVKLIDCDLNGQRHGSAEGVVNTAYGQTEDVQIVRPRFTRQWSSNFATHYQVVGRLTIAGAVLEGGSGINVRTGSASIEVVSAIGSQFVVNAYGHVRDLDIKIRGARNIRGAAVQLQPAAGTVCENVDVDVHVNGCRHVVYLNPAAGVKGGPVRVKGWAKNVELTPIQNTGFSAADGTTNVPILVGEFECYDWGASGAGFLISNVNGANSVIAGPIRTSRPGSFYILDHRGVTADNLSVPADIIAFSTDGGTVGGADGPLNVTAGTGHYAPRHVPAETCAVVADTITPRWRHDHRIRVSSTGTHPLTIAGVGRGRLTLHPLAPVPSAVTLQEGGNLQLDGNGPIVVTRRAPIVVEWNDNEFVQIGKQVA